MSEMVERVARALAEAAGDDYEENRSFLHRVARAAIEAVREPTEAMKYVGGTKAEDMLFGGDGTGVIFKDMGIVFTAMIDHALNEGEAQR